MLCIEDRTSTVVYALSLHDALPICGVIATRTRRSGIGAAAAVEHRVIDGEGVLGSEEAGHRVSTTTVAHLREGESLTLLKLAGYAWSHGSSPSALESAAVAAVRGGLDLGWDDLLRSQREVLDG